MHIYIYIYTHTYACAWPDAAEAAREGLLHHADARARAPTPQQNNYIEIYVL